MNINEIIKFLKENPAIISIPISIFALYYAFKSYKINRTRLGLDTFKIFNEFSNGLEALKKVQDNIDKLIVKTKNDITQQNLSNDLETIDFIIEEVNKNEDKIRSAYIMPTEVTDLKNKLDELKFAIKDLNFPLNDNLEKYLKVKSKYGFLYFQAFLMTPHILPKEFKQNEIDEKLNHTKFMTYYKTLVWER